MWYKFNELGGKKNIWIEVYSSGGNIWVCSDVSYKELIFIFLALKLEA
jgi:hypothetical protein